MRLSACSGAGAGPAEWIQAIARGRDRDGFVRLFRDFAPKLKSYFLRFGAPEAVADELTQEAMLRVWRRAAHFDPARGSAASWIFGLARNLAIDALRRDRHPDDLADLPEPEPQATPEQLVLQGAEAERVRDAVGQLDSTDADLVRQAFFQERSHSEIARLEGLPLGTVKSRIRRAAARLRSTLEDGA